MLDADAVDRLYAAPREDFVRDRDALVKSLRADGDREGAAEVAAIRKPTLVAWVVNRLAHDERREVDLLLDAGKRIIDAQAASIAKGGRDELDAAQASLRTAVAGLTERAAAILGPAASATTLTRVAETLRTAATTADGRELLARGRLSEELSGTGWEIIAGFDPSPRAPAKKPKKTSGSKAAQEQDAAERRAAAIETQAREVRELKKSLEAAEKLRRNAAREERKAAERLEELRTARSNADAEVESLAEKLERAEQELKELRSRR